MQPTTANPACSAIAGSTSSSSGSTGESMQNASLPDFTSVHVVCQMRDVTTNTSACSPTAFTSSGGAEQLGRFEQVLDLGGRLLLARLERLARAVDPDHRHLRSQARLDVVVVAGADVDPALLAADAT